jgi:hypothetical protein
MSNDFLLKLENSVNNLKNKKCKLHFLVQDTKGNAKASIRYIYQLAHTLHSKNFNVIIIHEQKEYQGVGSWLDEKYMEIPHLSIDGQNLEISPEDFIIVPELYGHVMEQVSKLPCGKIVLCQSYDYMFETLAPGASWAQYGFLKCITTTPEQEKYVSEIMKNVSFDILTPTISENFSSKEIPAKPIVSVHTRDQRDTIKIVKTFYLKYPQFRWITFRDLRGLSEQKFSENLKDSFVSVWVDDISGFGTFPLESMKTKTPVIGKIPNLKPEWIDENNGIWTNDNNMIVDILAEFIQNWLEDNISEKLYTSGLETAEKYSDFESFQNKSVELFNDYINKRLEVFENQYNKLKES